MNGLAIISTKFDIICCAETLASDMGHASELYLSNLNKPMLLRRNSLAQAQVLCLYYKNGFSGRRLKKQECGCHECVVVSVCRRVNKFYIFSPNFDVSVYDCLLISCISIEGNDRKSCFIFVGEFDTLCPQLTGISFLLQISQM